MTNHTEQFKRVEDTFEELTKEYEIFKKRISYSNRNNLKAKINEHREALTKLMTSVNDMFLKK